MTNSTTRLTWIDTGYDLFAKEGLDGIQVERLARITGLNKSGYYHYFGDQKSYLERLMQNHLTHGEAIAQHFKGIQHFDPQFPEVLIKHTTPVMVHNQLVRNRHDELFLQTYQQVNDIVDPVVIRLFADFIGFKDHLEFATKYYRQVRDMFYAQISFERMNYPFLRDFLYQAREVIQQAVAIASNTDSWV